MDSSVMLRGCDGLPYEAVWDTPTITTADAGRPLLPRSPQR